MSARNRRYRERQRAGRACFEIEADETGLIDALQRNGPPAKAAFSFVNKPQLPSETSWPKADILTALTNVCL